MILSFLDIIIIINLSAHPRIECVCMLKIIDIPNYNWYKQNNLNFIQIRKNKF